MQFANSTVAPSGDCDCHNPAQGRSRQRHPQPPPMPITIARLDAESGGRRKVLQGARQEPIVERVGSRHGASLNQGRQKAPNGEQQGLGWIGCCAAVNRTDVKQSSRHARKRPQDARESRKPQDALASLVTTHPRPAAERLASLPHAAHQHTYTLTRTLVRRTPTIINRKTNRPDNKRAELESAQIREHLSARTAVCFRSAHARSPHRRYMYGSYSPPHGLSSPPRIGGKR